MPTRAVDKKRAAPSSSAPSSATPSKKRKTDSNMKKYYAVKAGFKPGVYLSYSDCQRQTAGFKGAIFKSFTSVADAKDFVAGKKVQASPDEPDRFYAVAVGNPTGIYTDWSEASLSIKGVKGPKYKRFSTRAEAIGYIKEFGSKEAVKALGKEAAAGGSTTKQNDPLEVGDDIISIYTDGSSLANGKSGSRAGLGVFFGNGDPRNLAERLPGEPQTNQRAELMAIVRALEEAPADEDVQIFTDSQYSINCVTQWAVSWKRNGWRTAQGEPVKNQDIVKRVLALVDERDGEGAQTFFKWVKGHASDKGNMAADRLAVQGAQMPV